jgi:hypothetical protein
MKYLFWAYFVFACIFNKAFGGVMVINGLTHVHNTTKGSEVKGKITLKNDGKGTARVLIYRQDLVSECGKPFNYVASSLTKNSLGKWLSTNVDEKTLAPNEEYDLLYTILVPSKGAENGSYWQVIMVEGADVIKEENANGFAVNSKVRYAIQVIANVGPDQNSDIAFENVEFRKTSTPAITVVLKNTGLYASVVKVTIELYDEQGKKIKNLVGSSRRVYPSYCNSFDIEVNGVPKGKYVGLIVADNGTDMFGSNLSLEL